MAKQKSILKFTEENIKDIRNFGALSYPPEKIAKTLHLNVEQVIQEFNNTDSELRQAYDSGAEWSEYLIDMKLLEMAQSGDLKAINKLEKRKRKLKSTQS